MLKRSSIGRKIFISLAAIIILVIASNYFIFITQQQVIHDNFLSSLALANSSEREVLSNALEAVKKRTADFSSDGFIRDSAVEIVATNDARTVNALENYLVKSKLGLDSGLLGINILNNKGMVIASTDQGQVGKNESNDGYYPGTEDLSYGNVYISDFVADRRFSQGDVALVMAAPLTNRMTGMRIGTLMNFVKADSIISSLIQPATLPIGGISTYKSIHNYLVSRAGLVVTSRTLERGADSSIKCGEISSRVNASGVPVRSIGSCFENGWMLVTNIDEQEMLAIVRNVQQELAILMLLIILLIVLILYILNKQIIRPIQTLSAAAKRVGEGRLDVRTAIRSSDEVGDLSREFDEMTKRLREAHGILAQKVREVTRNLEKFELAVAGASDHVIITDVDGKIIYANRAAEEMTGYAQQEMLGNRPSLWGKQMPQEFYQRMWRTIKEEKKSFHGEVTNKRKEGALYVAEIHISPLFDEQGVLYGFVAIERDITKQKEIDRSKTEFVSIASHQLRTPLTIINWYVEMLSAPGDRELSQKQLQYLDEITRASKRMIELVNSLLNVSRIEMGTFMVEPEPVNFEIALEDVLKDLAPQIAKKRLSIVKRVDKDLPLIPADPKLLRMVLQNLVTNAVKYTQEEGVVTTSIEQRIGDILITIADTGMGIPLQQQSKIFQKFFRADNARMKEPDGNGLGLYIIRSIVESAGGEVWFSSEEDRGTAFYVTLPIAGMQKKEGTRALAV